MEFSSRLLKKENYVGPMLLSQRTVENCADFHELCEYAENLK
jgi:hypothetical protein